MMASTHVLAGMLLGVAVATLSPEAATPVVLAGAAGGLAPDLDALGTHRRDLHFPVYATVLAVGILAFATVTGWPWAAIATAFVGAGALHAVSDALGGGRSLRPWAESVERAVYCHAQARWWRPRGLIPYDGSPADLTLAIGLALATLALVETSQVRWLVGGLLAASVGYALVRRRVPDYVEALVARARAVGVRRSGESRP